MKILFVCQSNIGRSQMAMAFYNDYSHSKDADSAGISVEESGQTLLERKNTSTSKHFFLLDVMNKVGIDLSQAKRTQLTKDMLSKYDLVISMADEENIPEWLKKFPRFVYWNVKDPRGQSFEITAKIRDEIKDRVLKLLNK